MMVVESLTVNGGWKISVVVLVGPNFIRTHAPITGPPQNIEGSLSLPIPSPSPFSLSLPLFSLVLLLSSLTPSHPAMSSSATPSPIPHPTSPSPTSHPKRQQFQPTPGQTGACLTCPDGKFYGASEKDPSSAEACLRCTCPDGKSPTDCVGAKPDGSQPGTCEDCPAGKAGFNGKCTAGKGGGKCPSGKFLGRAGAVGLDACVLADTGSAARGPGAAEQEPCAPGKFSGNAGASECEKCAKGTCADKPGSKSCARPPVGSSCATPGSSDGVEGRSFVCPAGKATQAMTSECLACGCGRYTPAPGLTRCESCPKGKFTDGPGSKACAFCPAGKTTTTPGQCECGTSVVSLRVVWLCSAELLMCMSGECTCM